ncbi:MAG TPA: SulP family inorganic anion transporter [Gemmataceae bacterium]|nr:SulP family inorganic anion transporter [Gemmataceae bacterium]
MTTSDWLFRVVPAFDSLRSYSWHSFRLDFFAGLTVAAVAVPQAMAYASIPGLPVEYGLYTAIIMTAIGALFDSSRQLINGPTNAICIALASAIAYLPVDDHEQRLQAAILMAFLVGVFQTCITLFRLGDLTRFISNSVIVGFTLGAAILLALGQLRSFLGLPMGGASDDHFLVRFVLTMSRLDLVNIRALGIGAATILLALAFRQLGKRLRSQLPDFLMVVALMAGVVWFFGWDRGNVRVSVIGDMGDIPAGLPSFDLPRFDWSMTRQIISSSLAIAVLGLLEAIAMAKSIASRTGQKLDMNQQCLSEGLANLIGSFFQCMPGSGSLTRSAINVHAGAVSQWSGVFSAVAVALIVIVFAPLAKFIPRSCLAGLLLLSAYRLVDRKQLLYHLRSTPFDKKIVLATAFAAFAINIEFCILVGVFLSVVLYITRAARLHLTELTMTADRVIRERGPDDPRCDRILLYSLEGELFFGSGPDLEKHFDSIANQAGPVTRVIVLRLKRVRNPDAVCLELIERFIVKMRDRGIHVILCGVRDDFAATMRVCGLEAQLGKEYLFVEHEGATSSTLDAVRFAYGLLKGDYCVNCPRRNEERHVLYYMI